MFINFSIYTKNQSCMYNPEPPLKPNSHYQTPTQYSQYSDYFLSGLPYI